jgi:hypothetical protein
VSEVQDEIITNQIRDDVGSTKTQSDLMDPVAMTECRLAMAPRRRAAAGKCLSIHPTISFLVERLNRRGPSKS